MIILKYISHKILSKIKIINYDKIDVTDENLLIWECAKRCEVIRLRWYD